MIMAKLVSKVVMTVNKFEEPLAMLFRRLRIETAEKASIVKLVPKVRIQGSSSFI